MAKKNGFKRKCVLIDRDFQFTYLLTWIAMTMALLGGLVLASVSMFFIFKIKTVNHLVIGNAISAVLMFLGGFIPGKIQVFILMSLCFGIMDLMLPSAWAICLDVGKKYAGAISGAMNTAGNLGGFACATVFGYLVEATGSYNFPLYIIAGMLLISAFLFLRINPEKQIIAE